MVQVLSASAIGPPRTVQRTVAGSTQLGIGVRCSLDDVRSSTPRRRETCRRWLLATLVFGSCVSSSVEARRPRKEGLAMPLEAMTFPDAEKGGAVGSGCTWSGGPDRKGRMSMAGDRAAVKLKGRIVGLKPAVGAKEVFPFTYHRWTGSGMNIAIRDTAKVIGRGGESVVTMARLDLTAGGRTRSWQGRLDCGS